MYHEDAYDIIRFEGGYTRQKKYGIAVEICTTTIMAHLIHLPTGDILAKASKYNTQINYGEDVITRIIHTQEHSDGLGDLQHLVE
jgi:uncharacterized 2Fe-2S/4Fe-4S cluster protein (DUF4445 family)